jgi:hypothetical protein
MTDKFYNDFLGDAKIPKSGRIYCETCEQWIPDGGSEYGAVHTCHCARQLRGEDISKCQCVIHRNMRNPVDEKKQNRMIKSNNCMIKSNKIELEDEKGKVEINILDNEQYDELVDKLKGQSRTGLCYRCEHRAVYLEEGYAPRAECKDIEGNKIICYNYKPVKPCILKYPDYGDDDYNKLNKKRSPVGSYFGARMECNGVADVELEANEDDSGNWVFTWVLK